MFDLIGLKNDIGQDRIGGNFLDHYEEKLIATFDNEKDAKDYIKKSKLKHIQKRSYASDKVFKSRSLLSSCESAWVEGHHNEDIPHNPTL